MGLTAFALCLRLLAAAFIATVPLMWGLALHGVPSLSLGHLVGWLMYTGILCVVVFDHSYFGEV